MATYILFSRFSPEAFKDPHDFIRITETVSLKIKEHCPELVWKDSFATLGRYDALNIFETDDPKVGKLDCLYCQVPIGLIHIENPEKSDVIDKYSTLKIDEVPESKDRMQIPKEKVYFDPKSFAG